MKRKSSGDGGTVEIILQHGWGYDSSCFDSLLQFLWEMPGCQTMIQIPDRGYFGKPEPVSPFSGDSSVKVIVAHSLGLHLIPVEILQSADLLVLISAFRHFHGGSQLDRKRSSKKIRLMRSRLQDAPLDVIDDFYANCYHPLLQGRMLLMSKVESMNIELLRDDLYMLDKKEFALENIAGIGQILLIHGKQDSIVSPLHSYQLSEFLPTSSLVLIDRVGHSLPITHAEPVWICLRNKLRHLLRVKS